MCLYIFHLLISYLGQLYHWCPNCVLPHLMVLGVQFRTLYMEDKHSNAELHIQLNSKVICYKVQALGRLQGPFLLWPQAQAHVMFP